MQDRAEVGALVRATIEGTVRESVSPRGTFLRGGSGLTAWDMWLPPEAEITVLSPPLPSEVLLLECGHVCGGARPLSPSDSIWCDTCDNRFPLRAIGGVTWGGQR